MQSKRGKAKNVATAKLRSVRPKPKGQKSTSNGRRARQARGSNPTGGQVPQALSIQAPANYGIVQSRMFGLRFDRAAPHDEFPEGGLRIHGVLPYSQGVFTNDTVLFGVASSAGLASVGINPTAATVNGTTVAMIASTSPLAVFAQYFRRFRFRRVNVNYSSMIAPGVTDTAAGSGLVIQVAHEPDIVTAEQASGSYTQDTAVVSKNCTRFAVWTNNLICPVISEQKSSASDELFYCTGPGDVIATTGDAEMRQAFQGAFTATSSAVTSGGDVAIAKVLIEFAVDLYGFTNIAVGVLPSKNRTKLGREEKRPSERVEKSDEKDSRDYELVSLDGQNRLRVRSDIVDAVQTPAKSQSLKGTRS